MSKTNSFSKPMSPDEFQDSLDAANLAQTQYAAMVGVSPIAIAKRKSGENKIPPEGAILLRLLSKRPELVPVAWEAAGKPEGVEVSAAGRPPKRKSSNG